MIAMEGTAKRKLHTLGGWLKKNYALFLAPMIVALLYLFALDINDVYPFGDKYTAASYDLSAQIAPFIEHLFDVFDGKSTLTFSYAIVGGADVTGTFLYFFISPFSFLFLILGDGMVAHASSIVMLCKLTTVSVAGVWFAKKLFKGIPEYICLAVGVTYAYCGYTFVSNTYINWMDFLIYLPFTTAAFVRFVKTGKFLRFSILVACNIYTCFSIACFSLFTVFPALIAYAILCVEKEERKRFVAYLCLSFLVAILISLPVLFPALGAYSVSGRGGSLFENLWNGFTVNALSGELESFNSSAFIENYSQATYRKWTYIFSDSIFVILTFVWFVRTGLKDKFARFMLVAGVLTLLPTLVDESMNLLNMGSYMSYSLRFGFLNALYFLGGACLCLQGICYKPRTSYDGKEIIVRREKEEKKGGRYALKGIFCKKNTLPLLALSGLVLLCLAVVGFLIWFSYGTNYKTFLKLFDIEVKSFSGVFAHSLGGLEIILVLFLAVALVAFVGGFLVAGRKLSPRMLSLALIAVVAAQVCFYNNHLVVGNRSTQHTTFGDYGVLCQEFNERDEGYFRVKDYDDSMTACVPFTGGSNSFSVFSSVIDKDNFATYQLFGYNGNGKNSFKSGHNFNKGNRSDEFGDAFMGYKYFVSTQDDLHTQDGLKKYIKPMYKLDENGATLLDKDGNPVRLAEGEFFAYENTIVFPLGYTVEGSYSFTVKNDNAKWNRKINQQGLYKFLRGQDLKEKTGKDYVTPESATELSAYLKSKAADVEVSAGKITARVNGTAGENLLLNFVAVKGYTVTVNGREAELIDNDLKFLSVALDEGENEVVFTYRSPYGKQALFGLICAVLGLLAIWAVLKWTKLFDRLAPVISWAGVILAVGVVAFFMIFPTGVLLTKIIELVKLWI